MTKHTMELVTRAAWVGLELNVWRPDGHNRYFSFEGSGRNLSGTLGTAVQAHCWLSGYEAGVGRGMPSRPYDPRIFLKSGNIMPRDPDEAFSPHTHVVDSEGGHHD
jgi:hypothetical protein